MAATGTTTKCSGLTCTAVALHECARCHAAAYCSVACQTADWPAHKPHCRAPSAQAQALAAGLQAILGKWAAQGTFTRFLDGNPANGAPGNAVPASLREALSPANLAAWRVDWDAALTSEEAALVRSPAYSAALLLARLPGDPPRGEAAATPAPAPAAAGGGGGGASASGSGAGAEASAAAQGKGLD
jgi:hypothetical protein